MQWVKRDDEDYLLKFNNQNITRVYQYPRTKQSFALKRSTLYRNTVNSVFRLGTIDGRTVARLDDVVDAERGLIAAGLAAYCKYSLFNLKVSFPRS